MYSNFVGCNLILFIIFGNKHKKLTNLLKKFRQVSGLLEI